MSRDPVSRQRSRVQAAERKLAEERRLFDELLAQALNTIEAERARLAGDVPKPLPHDVQHPNMGRMDLGQEDSRALKIAKTRTKGRRRPPEVQALYDAGLTPNEAAAICRTTRDVLKQAWATGDQFREIRPEWRKALAKRGVPASVWRSSK